MFSLEDLMLSVYQFYEIYQLLYAKVVSILLNLNDLMTPLHSEYTYMKVTAV